MAALTSFYDFQVKSRSLGILSVIFSLLWISNPDSARSDTLSIYFPPALEKDTGFQTSTGGSLEGFVVRAGALSGTTTASQLISSLAGKTTSTDILNSINSSFLEYSSFSMADAYLSDPNQAIVTLSGSMNNANFKGKDIYLLFYNSATASAANEIGIFRMANREDNPDGSTGIFPTGNNATGGRESIFSFADPEGILGPESYLNLLTGQYDSLNNKFILGNLSGGIGQITSPLNATNSSGVAFNYQITANNGADSYFATTNTNSPLTSTDLPSWASINTNTGVINFTTNSVPGNYAIRLVASNSLTASVATNTLSLVLQAPSMSFTTTTAEITATAGVSITPFSFIAGPGASPLYTVISGDLLGLALSTGGTLSGIPTSAGTSAVTIQASSGGQTGTTTFTLTVEDPTLAIPNGALTDGQILTTAGVGATIAITKTDGFTGVTGSLEPAYEGVSFDGSNLIIAPTAPPLPKGTLSIILTLTASRTVENSIVSASTTVPLRIVAPVPTNLRFIESFTDANANQVYDSGESYIDSVLNDQYDSSTASSSLEVFVGEPYSISFSTSASGVCPLQDFSISGSGLLPSGLQLQTVDSRGGNQISGINSSTTAPSDYTITLVADTSRFYEGGGTLSSTITFRLRNRNAPYFYPLTSRLLGAQGKYLKFNLSAENSPFKYEATNLPSWLSLKSNQGQWVLEGTPTSAGIFSIPVTAYNAFRPGSTNPSDWNAGYGTLIIHVSASRPNNVALTGANNLQVRSSASFYLVPGGAEGAGVRVNATGLPPGLVLDRTTSQVTGTPTAKGSFVVTIYIQNGKGWVTKTMTLTVR